MERKKPEFKCKYCGTTMEFREHRKGDTWEWMSYACTRCGSTGPVAINHKDQVKDMGEKTMYDDARKWLDRSMLCEWVGNLSRTDSIRRLLQKESGKYAGMKAMDLPEAERRVKEAYRLFKFDSVRPKDLDFRAWIKEMAKSTARLARAMDLRDAAIKKFQAVKSEMRRLQKELALEKKKEGKDA